MPAVGSVASARRLEVFLIRPTKYDDDGYLIRHRRGVLPANSLACLCALTEDVGRRRILGSVQLRTHLCDESVQRLPARRIRRAARCRTTRALVCLAGVQTSQFPRAVDLARRFRRRGVQVMIGGFHVSGLLAATAGLPGDLRQLMGEGITLVRGEVEENWGAILRDAAAGKLAPLYDSSKKPPDLLRAPVPRPHPRLLRKFVYRHFGTMDTSRGCPFTCSFCTISSVQGRRVRHRDAAAIGAAIEATYRAGGTHHYFFTDDNFARNQNWRAILAELVRLREGAGIPLRFLMQVDAGAHRIPDFVALARRAGCFQVFIGMESLNPESLAGAGKRQNRVEEYAALVDAWHAAGMLTHVGYIIGFPHDTAATVRENLRVLKEEIRPDIASFFVLTPLPGSADYARLLVAGAVPDPDLNRYDTFRPVSAHPRMSRAEWSGIYREAWRSFYSTAYMKQQLLRVWGPQRITLLQIYLWYMTSAFVERLHPMIGGFLRLKPRVDRRPGSVVEGRLRHLRRRAPEVVSGLVGYATVLRRVERLWIETCQPAVWTGKEQAGSSAEIRRPGAARRLRPRALLGRVDAEVRLGVAFSRAMFGRADAPVAYARSDLRPGLPPARTRKARIETSTQP